MSLATRELIEAMLRLGDPDERGEWFAIRTGITFEDPVPGRERRGDCLAPIDPDDGDLDAFDSTEEAERNHKLEALFKPLPVVLHWVPEAGSYAKGTPKELLAICGGLKVSLRGNTVDFLNEEQWAALQVCPGCAETWTSMRE